MQRVAIVTGGGDGIGRLIATHLAASGATVVLIGRRGAVLHAAITEIANGGGAATSVQSDLADPAAARHVVSVTLRRLGRVDVIVNNAAAQSHRRVGFADMTQPDFHEAMTTNVGAPLFLVQAALDALKQSDAPAVVNVSSASAHRHVADRLLYGASKSALEYVTRWLAVDLAPHGIRVNAVAPGPVAPLAADGARGAAARGAATGNGRIPADEVARWVCHLADPQSSVSGAIVDIINRSVGFG